jgi:hypothetical protein
MKNVFGFSTVTSAGDFIPIIKYDARAGRIYRVDRVDTGNGFESKAVDITQSFKAVIDFEYVEVGWIDFPVGSAPSFVLVPMGSQLPDRPGPKHKNGIRLMLKLSNDCAGGSAAIREIAGTSKAFVSGIEALYNEYEKEKAANPGKLPVAVFEKVTAVKAGNGSKSSTNFQPTFRIVGWKPRGDLTFVPKGTPAAGSPPESQPQMTPAPTPLSTDSIHVQAPSEEQAMADDFG